MLCGAKLPKRFWGEALSTAVYLRNRSPARALSGITPDEVWNGEKPDVAHLRVFGSHAHVTHGDRNKSHSIVRFS